MGGKHLKKLAIACFFSGFPPKKIDLGEIILMMGNYNHFLIMQQAQLDRVKEYIELRVSNQETKKEGKLVDLFDTEGVMVDIEGKEHKGHPALLKYYQQPQEPPSSYEAPKALPDGRVY